MNILVSQPYAIISRYTTLPRHHILSKSPAQTV